MSKRKFTSASVSALALSSGLNIALTGGPSVGKTTMAKWMLSVGFTVRPEMASVLIQQCKLFLEEKGLPLSNDAAVQQLCNENEVYHPMVDNPAFQSALVQKQLDQEQPHMFRGSPGLVCFDRTYLDGLAYCEHYGVAVPEKYNLVFPPPRLRYDLCFLLANLNLFVDNGVRVENKDAGVEFSKIIGPRLGDIYRRHDVPVIEVPAMSLLEREDFIWQHIKIYADNKKRAARAA